MILNNRNIDSQRASNTFEKPTYSKEVAETVEEICQKLNLPEFELTRTNTTAPHHRRLCLYTCDFGDHDEKVASTVKSLIREGMFTKAAALAIIHGQAKLAFQALRSGSNSSAHRELSMALAGYNKGLADDETWRETVSELSATLNDPFARAILALVRSGNPKDVLTETSLPLRWRIGVALMYLDDEELSDYIDSHLARCIEAGDLEGIVLAGLTERAVPLFATYIRNSNDLQTAVLATAIACPRYFTDSRVDTWRETYRSYLNAWRLFPQRARFDVESARFSASSQAEPGERTPARQMTLRCNYCDTPLDHSLGDIPGRNPSTKFSTRFQKIFDMTGTVCPNCGHHLPRCVFCEEWLGMPNLSSRAGFSHANNNPGIMEKYLVKCQRCSHMLHGDHAMEWFAKHTVCPAEECDCRCSELDHGRGVAVAS